ncbi:hypothetical protein LCGC14_2200450 [marine sediment metagenome]|uniref:Uncharacterized protein n=1 Tax=marine sediment metagenome TaxID=412755 RepID=A0A0F9FU85_9ZZZZ
MPHFNPGEKARVKIGFTAHYETKTGRINQIPDGTIVIINHANSPDYSTYDVTTGGNGGIGQGGFPAIFLEKIMPE